MEEEIFDIESVRLRDEDSKLVILDQTLLPNKVEYVDLQTLEEIWNAIYRLQVRGAPAIGVAAGYGAYLGAKAIKTDDYTYFIGEFEKVKKYLASSRPTAVNLFWALNRMEDCITKNKSKRVAEIKEILRMEADNIKTEDIEICKSIGKTGAALLEDGMGILTHCNAGTLATSKYGTALSPVYMAIEQRGFKNLKVFCDETRPLLQGARLTAFELMQAGVDTTLICDNMASMVMKNGWVQAVFVGCDRVAANGDTANKIGTSGVAILAAHYRIPFYVCGPTSTIDLNTETGGDINIELRKSEEVTEMWYKERMAPKGVGVYNPAFDVTDNNLITGIITEYGMAKAPYSESLKEITERNGKNL